MTDTALPNALRMTCVGTSAACALPMLLHLPAGLASLLLATFAVGLFSRRRWPMWFRLLLAVAVLGTVFASFRFQLGRDTASAVLIATLALKTLEMNNLRDAHSLVGFSLFAPFAGLLQSQGPLTLALALPAVLAIVTCLQRLAESGHPLHTTPLAVKPLIIRSLRTLALALPLALTAFWLFPRLASPLWGMPDNAISRTGMNDRMSPGDWLDVMNDDTPAFRVRFSGNAPPLQHMYWRGPILSHFDGRTWTRASWTSGLDRPRTEPAGEPLKYEVTLDPTDRRYLFALDLPDQVSVPATIGADGSVIANQPVRGVLRYQAQSTPAESFEADLRTTLRNAALELPDGFNPRTLALAQSWRLAGDNDQQVIQRALDWINREFSYSLETPLLGRHSVDEFLFDTRIGFCEHFSSAFVVLMRAAGIPARVVTGYAGGYHNTLGGFWLIRQSDAHAWSEVWLPERGWVRIDPTAAVAPERVFETLNQPLETGALAAIRDVVNVGDWARNHWNDFLLQFDAIRQRTLLRPLGIDDASTLQLGIAFSTGAGLMLALTLWLLLRGQREPIDPLMQEWRRFERRMARVGWPKETAESAQHYGERLALALPEQAAVLRSFSQRFTDWRYAAHAIDESQQNVLIHELRRFRPG